MLPPNPCKRHGRQDNGQRHREFVVFGDDVERVVAAEGAGRGWTGKPLVSHIVSKTFGGEI